VPVLPKTRELSEQGAVDAGVAMNQSAFEKSVKWEGGIAEADRNLLWESESSGGLLIALPEECVRQYQQMAEDKGIKAPVVGEVVAGEPGIIEVGR